MLALTIPQVLAYVGAGQQLVQAGVMTVQAIRDLIKGNHPELPEADLNAMCASIASGAARHEALAHADAGGS